MRGILPPDALEGFATKYISSYQGLREELVRANNTESEYTVPAMRRFSSFGIHQFRAWFATQAEPNLGKIVLNIGELDEVVRELFIGSFRISDFNNRLAGLECFIRQTLNNE